MAGEKKEQKNKSLTEKQKRFCDEYLIDLNATQAAIRAGYSARTARQMGQENLTKPVIKEYIQKRMAEKDAELVADQDEVLRYLTSVMRREATENIVVTVSERVSSYEPDEKGTMRKVIKETETAQVVQIPARLSDANRAAELLGKAHGIYDRIRHEIDRDRLELERQKSESLKPDKEIKVIIGGYETEWSE